jgi:hypothetical protein
MSSLFQVMHRGDISGRSKNVQSDIFLADGETGGREEEVLRVAAMRRTLSYKNNFPFREEKRFGVHWQRAGLSPAPTNTKATKMKKPAGAGEK